MFASALKNVQRSSSQVFNIRADKTVVQLLVPFVQYTRMTMNG